MVLATGGEHVGERIAIVDRHQLRAQRVVGRVQRQRQADRDPLGGQPLDTGNPADRRDRGVAGGDPEVGQLAAGLQHRVEVHHWLAHTHEHRVVHGTHAPEVQGLIEDLRGCQVAPEAHLPGRTEAAGQGAARLRGEAQRAPPVAVGHEHGLQRAAVAGAQQGLDRAVSRASLVLECQARERHRRGQRRAQRQWQIGHGIETGGAPRRPFPYLTVSVLGLAELLQCAL